MRRTTRTQQWTKKKEKQDENGIVGTKQCQLGRVESREGHPRVVSDLQLF